MDTVQTLKILTKYLIVDIDQIHYLYYLIRMNNEATILNTTSTNLELVCDSVLQGSIMKGSIMKKGSKKVLVKSVRTKVKSNVEEVIN